jgi:hypothetical protein
MQLKETCVTLIDSVEKICNEILTHRCSMPFAQANAALLRALFQNNRKLRRQRAFNSSSRASQPHQDLNIGPGLRKASLNEKFMLTARGHPRSSDANAPDRPKRLISRESRARKRDRKMGSDASGLGQKNLSTGRDLPLNHRSRSFDPFFSDKLLSCMENRCPMRILALKCGRSGEAHFFAATQRKSPADAGL